MHSTGCGHNCGPHTAIATWRGRGRYCAGFHVGSTAPASCLPPACWLQAAASSFPALLGEWWPHAGEAAKDIQAESQPLPNCSSSAWKAGGPVWDLHGKFEGPCLRRLWVRIVTLPAAPSRILHMIWPAFIGKYDCATHPRMRTADYSNRDGAAALICNKFELA